jgi:hypothetical protein
MSRLARIACVAAAMAIGTRAAAQEPTTPAFGDSSLGVEVVDAWDMDPVDSTGEIGSIFNGNRYITNGAFLGVAHMPQGAEIVSIELDGCDTDTMGGIAANLRQADASGGATVAEVVTQVAATPGCGRFSAIPAAPQTVNNVAYRYIVTVSGGNVQTTIGAVRVYYRRTVIKAPVTPTFNDVPTTDPAYQFIEALVASGATAGCGGGNYCPDAPLTRRQMAVFLAKLLGLHWPEEPGD